MESRSFDMSSLPSPRAIRSGAQMFIGLSLTGMLASMWWKQPMGLGEFLTRMHWMYVPLILPLLAIDYFLGGFRYRLFFNGKQLPFVSQWDCMRSNWANISMGAVTPFHSGAGPAQLYIWWRKGASLTDGMLVTMINFVATLVFFMLSSIAALIWLPENLFGDNFTVVFRTGFSVVVLVVTVSILIMLFPQAGLGLIRNFLGILPLGEVRRQKILLKAEGELRRFHDGFRNILRENKRGLVLTVLATIWLYFNKYVIGFTIVTAMGLNVPFDVFVGLQIIQLLLLYFAPTPGASGLAELSTVWLMEKLMPQSMLLIYAVFWRLTLTILPAVIGGFVMFFEFQAMSRENALKPATVPEKP